MRNSTECCRGGRRFTEEAVSEAIGRNFLQEVNMVKKKKKRSDLQVFRAICSHESF